MFIATKYADNRIIIMFSHLFILVIEDNLRKAVPLVKYTMDLLVEDTCIWNTLTISIYWLNQKTISQNWHATVREPILYNLSIIANITHILCFHANSLTHFDFTRTQYIPYGFSYWFYCCIYILSYIFI